MDTGDLITIDEEILGGTPVFKGTRVPIKTLFEYLENNHSLEEFLKLLSLGHSRICVSGIGICGRGLSSLLQRLIKIR